MIVFRASRHIIINLTILECKLHKAVYVSLVDGDNKSNHIGM